MKRSCCAAGMLALLIALSADIGQALADATSSRDLQVDAARSGRLWGAGVLPPLHFAWSVPVKPSTSQYPVVVGRVAIAVDATNAPRRLLAVSLASGRIVWKRNLAVLGGGIAPYLAAERGRVFVAGDANYPDRYSVTAVVQAFDAATGRHLWDSRPGGSTFPSQPVVSNGTLYMETISGGSDRSAVRETDGKVLWLSSDAGSSFAATFNGGPLTLARHMLTGYDGCGGGAGTDSRYGVLEWIDFGSCSTSGVLGAYAGGYVWFGNPDAITPNQPFSGAPNVVLDPATGRRKGTFPAGASPVFADGVASQLRLVQTGTPEHLGGIFGGNLAGFDPGSGRTEWRFEGHRRSRDIATLPLAADGYIFAASEDGTLWALQPKTGKVVWSGRARGRHEVGAGWGLAAGDGYIVILTADRLIAFRGAGTPRGSAPAWWTQPPPRPGISTRRHHHH